MPSCQALTSVLCLHYRPETVHCSTKDVYTSEITFLALHPWVCLKKKTFFINIWFNYTLPNFVPDRKKFAKRRNKNKHCIAIVLNSFSIFLEYKYC